MPVKTHTHTHPVIRNVCLNYTSKQNEGYREVRLVEFSAKCVLIMVIISDLGLFV